MLRVAVINHLLAEKADLRQSLAQHAGQIGCLAIPPARITFAIDATGLLAASDAEPDATITVSPWILPRLALGDHAAEREVQIDGDAMLAGDLAQVFRSLNWNIERDLSRLTGDIIANRIGQTVHDLVGDPRQIVRNLAEASSEFVQEEARLLVPRASIEAFNQAVDTLRDDAARLAKRIEQLIKHHG